MEEKDQNPNAPVDKKRIALLNGCCGQAGRVLICGQVVDVPITQTEKDGNWDYFTNLPVDQTNFIRPMQDFSMSAVRRPRLQLEILASPDRILLKPDQLDRTEIVYTSEIFNANDDSFFSLSTPENLTPGHYIVRVILRGVDSLRQSVSDLSYIGSSDSLILKKDIPIGFGRMLILSADSRELILTSDIDQTFLDTQSSSTQGLMETLFETPDAKKPIAGMPELLRQIYIQNENRIPVFFISASPHFFRRTLAAVFAYHGIFYATLNLKYLLSTIDSILRKVLHTVTNLDEFIAQGLSNALDRSMKFLGSSFLSLFDQVAYKLTVLLENRLMQPTGAREILLGDNTESDFFIFTLYQFILLGKISGEELENYLYHLNFQNREALTRDAARRIRALAEENLKLHGRVNSVHDIWINLAHPQPTEKTMFDVTKISLPPGCGMIEDPQIAKFRVCLGGPGFAFAAFDSRLIDIDRLRLVLKSVKGAAFRGEPINAETLVAAASEFAFRNPEAEASAKDALSAV